jgi:hypothetical protein
MGNSEGTGKPLYVAYTHSFLVDIVFIPAQTLGMLVSIPDFQKI